MTFAPSRRFARIRRRRLAGLAIALALLAAGCGGTDLSTEDAHDTRNRCNAHAPGNSSVACLDDSQKRVIAFPNHFHNIATACDGFGHRVYQTTDNSNTKFVADPSCPGWTENTPKMGVVTDAG